ncbi:MAG TPA: lytic transglycosylase domain-containing protein, partial [Gaiellales bacterium]|nr:lytic transglycosylase domain-containing protein [Gaiellales bacterium]
ESRFRPSTRSSAGAIGLMQLLPSTARGIAARTGGTGFRASDLYGPDLNIRYGTWYLADLIHRYRRDRADTQLALAAYNAGSANVDRWIASTPPGRPVTIRFSATRSYVAGVLHARDLYRRAYGAQLGP